LSHNVVDSTIPVQNFIKSKRTIFQKDMETNISPASLNKPKTVSILRVLFLESLKDCPLTVVKEMFECISSAASGKKGAVDITMNHITVYLNVIRPLGTHQKAATALSLLIREGLKQVSAPGNLISICTGPVSIAKESSSSSKLVISGACLQWIDVLPMFAPLLPHMHPMQILANAALVESAASENTFQLLHRVDVPFASLSSNIFYLVHDRPRGTEDQEWMYDLEARHPYSDYNATITTALDLNETEAILHGDQCMVELRTVHQDPRAPSEEQWVKLLELLHEGYFATPLSLPTQAVPEASSGGGSRTFTKRRSQSSLNKMSRVASFSSVTRVASRLFSKRQNASAAMSAGKGL